MSQLMKTSIKLDVHTRQFIETMLSRAKRLDNMGGCISSQAAQDAIYETMELLGFNLPCPHWRAEYDWGTGVLEIGERKE